MSKSSFKLLLWSGVGNVHEKNQAQVKHLGEFGFHCAS